MIRKLRSGEYRFVFAQERREDWETEESGNVFLTRAAQKHERAVQYFKRAVGVRFEERAGQMPGGQPGRLSPPNQDQSRASLPI